MGRLSPRSRLHGEQGASLVVILALTIILGLCVGGIAVQGTAGMLAVQGVKNQRDDIYGAAGAIDAALNYVRGDITMGRYEDVNCPGGTANPDFFSAPSESGTVTVSCKSLAPGGLEVEGINYPENSIRTMSGLPGYPVVTTNSTCPGDPGICVGGNNDGRMRIDGSVKSNAPDKSAKAITSRNGTRINVGLNSIRATGLCSPTAGTEYEDASPMVCATGDTYPDPSGTNATTDPTTGGWASLIQTMPAPAPLPRCNPTSKVATMYPGSYFDRNAMLRAFTKVVSGTRQSCPVVWIQPGLYYFDFSSRNEAANALLDYVPVNDPWRIGYNDATQDQIYNETFSGTDIPGSVVIGGTLTSAIDPNAQTSQVTAARNAVGDPGACERGAPGVQLMMANDTGFEVENQGKVELCPNPESQRQRLVLVGRKSDQSATASASGTFRPWVGSSSPAGWADTFDPDLLAIDGATASVEGAGDNQVRTINFERFGPTTAGLMPQQTLGTVTLKVAHRETTTPTALTVSISARITKADGSSPAECTTTTAFTEQTVLTTQQWAVPSTCVSNIKQLAGASLEWKVTGAPFGNPAIITILDGAEFDVTYTAQSGLQAKSAGSRIVWMDGNPGDKSPKIFFRGTVYAPTSAIRLDYAGVSTTVAQFDRGVVVAALLVENLRVDQPFKSFGNVSGVRHYTDRVVELIAHVAGKPSLRVWVEFDDSNPSLPGKIVRIKRWNAVN